MAVSRDYDPVLDGPPRQEPKAPELPAAKNYPLCPQCGANTIVLFAPTRDDVFNDLDKRYSVTGPERIDWHRAHLYCCNGQTNCDVEIPIMTGLATPVKERRRKAIITD